MGYLANNQIVSFKSRAMQVGIVKEYRTCSCKT